MSWRIFPAVKYESCNKLTYLQIIVIDRENKLSPAVSKLKEAQFSYFKDQGQLSWDWLTEAQLSNLSLTQIYFSQKSFESFNVPKSWSLVFDKPMFWILAV